MANDQIYVDIKQIKSYTKKAILILRIAKVINYLTFGKYEHKMVYLIEKWFDRKLYKSIS